jgi:LPXTG-motif cell wall-anchored protein
MAKSKQIIKPIALILLILFGVFIFFCGGYDDSPGAQLLGLVLVVIVLVFLLKKKKYLK